MPLTSPGRCGSAGPSPQPPTAVSGHVSLHSLAAAQTRDARAADERRRQTWAFVTVALVVGLAAALLLERS